MLQAAIVGHGLHFQLSTHSRLSGWAAARRRFRRQQPPNSARASCPPLPLLQRVAALLKSGVRDVAGVKDETVADVADALEGSSELALSEDRKRVRRSVALKAVDEVRFPGWKLGYTVVEAALLSVLWHAARLAERAPCSAAACRRRACPLRCMAAALPWGREPSACAAAAPWGGERRLPGCSSNPLLTCRPVAAAAQTVGAGVARGGQPLAVRLALPL